MRSGLGRCRRGQIFSSHFSGFLGGSLGIVPHRRCRGFASLFQLRRILLREFAGRLGKCPSKFRSGSDDLIVCELVPLRVHPFALHVHPTICRLYETSASHSLIGRLSCVARAWSPAGFCRRFGPQGWPRHCKTNDEQKNAGSLPRRNQPTQPPATTNRQS